MSWKFSSVKGCCINLLIKAKWSGGSVWNSRLSNWNTDYKNNENFKTAYEFVVGLEYVLVTWSNIQIFFFLKKNLFRCPTAKFGPLSRGQPYSPDVNHCVLHFRPEGQLEPRNEVGSLSPAKRLVGFALGTFRFLLERLNPLDHSPL